MGENSSGFPSMPRVNIRIGSCPDCGNPIWLGDLQYRETENLKAVYKCIACRHLWARDEIVPF